MRQLIKGILSNIKEFVLLTSNKFWGVLFFLFIYLFYLFSNIQTSQADSEPVSNTSVARASKNLSRMNNSASSGATSGNNSGGLSGIGQGQKDLSAIKSKVPNQIPINVFWNYIEPFFKPIDEDDLKYLDDPSHVMDVAPFIIPPLGLHYEKIWYEQYGYVVPGGDANKRDSSRLLNDQHNQVQLRDRLLSALIDKKAEFFDNFEDEEYGDDFLMMDNLDNPESSSVSLDDRLRTSLNELGFTDLVSSRDYQENDEICVEMRSVQRQLREQIVINQYRKKRLAEFIRTKLASQEFYSLIGDLDKQIDGIFQKRVKNAKKKKTAANSSKMADSTSSVSTILSGSNEVPTEAIQCLDNRRKLLDNFVEIVPSRIESLCPPSLVEFEEQVEMEILESAKKTSKWLPLPEIPLKQPLSSSQAAFPNSR